MLLVNNINGYKMPCYCYLRMFIHLYVFSDDYHKITKVSIFVLGIYTCGISVLLWWMYKGITECNISTSEGTVYALTYIKLCVCAHQIRKRCICSFYHDLLVLHCNIVTVFWRTDHLRTRTEIHVLPVHDRHTHALSRNTKYWTIDKVCFYRRLFIDAVKPRGCISWPWGASIGLHGVPGCSSRQSWPPLCIVTVCATD